MAVSLSKNRNLFLLAGTIASALLLSLSIVVTAWAQESKSGNESKESATHLGVYLNDFVDSLPSRIQAYNDERDRLAEEARKAEEEQKAAEEAAEREKVEKISQELPQKGLEEKYIDKTWLGEPYEMNVLSEGEDNECNCYTWASKNGKDDIIFYAYCTDGVVSNIKRGEEFTNYWPDLWGMPDLYASGEKRPSAADNLPTYSPEDFNSPEEYADNADQWFADRGYEDPWDAAYLYWENNH